MHIAPLTPDHAPDYRALMLQAYTQAADAFTTTAEERAAEPLAWWARRIAAADGSSVALGAFDGTALVGTVTVEFSAKPKTRHQAKLIGMFVHESRRGQGTGAALVHAAIALARNRPGTRTLGLTLTEGNEAALGLYRRCGFQAFGTEPLAILTPQGFRAKVHMWLDLAATPSVT